MWDVRCVMYARVMCQVSSVMCAYMCQVCVLHVVCVCACVMCDVCVCDVRCGTWEVGCVMVDVMCDV